MGYRRKENNTEQDIKRRGFWLFVMHTCCWGAVREAGFRQSGEVS